jgi:hypothetical protein
VLVPGKFFQASLISANNAEYTRVVPIVIAGTRSYTDLKKSIGTNTLAYLVASVTKKGVTDFTF